MNKYVIFHKRVRVFYQGFQTHGNNRIHETVYQAIFSGPSGFYCPECFATSREQWISLGERSSEFDCSKVFVTPVKQEPRVYEITSQSTIVYCFTSLLRLSKVRGSWFLAATDFCHPQARQIHRCIFAPVTSVNAHYYSVLTAPFCKIYI
jgi:hypothetical protein